VAVSHAPAPPRPPGLPATPPAARTRAGAEGWGPPAGRPGRRRAPCAGAGAGHTRGGAVRGGPAAAIAATSSSSSESGWYFTLPAPSYIRNAPRSASSAGSPGSGVRSRWARATPRAATAWRRGVRPGPRVGWEAGRPPPPRRHAMARQQVKQLVGHGPLLAVDRDRRAGAQRRFRAGRAPAARPPRRPV